MSYCTPVDGCFSSCPSARSPSSVPRAAHASARVFAGVSLPNWFSSSVGRVMLFRKAPKYMLFTELSCINKYQHFSPDLCSFAGFLLNAEHTKPPFIPREARIALSPCLCAHGGAERHLGIVFFILLPPGSLGPWAHGRPRSI